MRTIIFGAAMALSLPCALAAAAQDAPPVIVILPDPALQSCELHIWPAPPLQSVTEGWWHADPVRRPSIGSPETDPAILSAERQLAIIPAARIAGALHIPAAQIVSHPQPMPRVAVIQPGAPTAAPCAAELVVQRSIFEKGVMSTGSIRVFATVRRWDKGQLAWSYTGFAASDAPGFPPTAEADPAAALASAETAWTRAVTVLAMQAVGKHPTP